MPVLLFALLEIAFFPFQLIGSLAYAFRVRFVNMPRGISGTMMTFISHRTHFFDNVVAAAAAADSPIRQFVVLGAGWDTRSYGPLPGGADLRAPGGRDSGEALRCFKVDEPPTQEAKVEALRAGGVDCGHVVFAPTDFNQQSWLESLTQHGFDPDSPTFILWEGVTMYLDDAAVDRTLSAVAGLAPGSRIAFDSFSRELVFGRKPFVVRGTPLGGLIGAGVPDRPAKG